MKRIAIVGAVGAGKTTLFNALQGNYSLARKTQALEFNDRGDIDTPGEYFSHPRWYHALITTLQDVDTLIYVHAANDTESRQRIRETILAQLPEGQFTESLVAQLMEKVMKEKQSLEQEAMQPGFDSVTGKGGIKVIDGSSVKFGRFDGAQPHCVGLTDLVTDQDGSSMAAGFMQWENAFFPWTLNYDEIDMVLEGELHVRHQGETLVAKAGDVMFIPKGSSIEFGTPSTVRFLYVAWPANWQSL